MIIGLTGQSGAGKSTISATFEKKGYFIIDCDLIARDVVKINQECLDKLTKEFSANILNDKKELNRESLSSIVFNDKNKLLKLNEIIFPYIIDLIKDKIKLLLSNNLNNIVLDAPTLFEANANELCDVVVSVIADKTLRLERIIERDRLTKEQALSRLNSQKDDDFYISRSDFTVYNNGCLWEFMQEINNIIDDISKPKTE